LTQAAVTLRLLLHQTLHGASYFASGQQ
jgi:hypothetical protein